MRSTLVVMVSAALVAAGCASGSREDESVTARPGADAETAAPDAAAADAPASPEAMATAERFPPPSRDGGTHRWELRAFKDNHVEVWMDGERVADDRIRREAHRVAVLDAQGTVIERLDLPASWTPEHGAAAGAGQFRRVDGTVLVPPASMLGGRLEPVPPATLAHLRAEHTAEDGSKCASVARVIPGLPLDRAGLRSHDVVVAVNGSADASPDAIRAVVRAAKPGDAIRFTVVRAGRKFDASVTLAAWDPKHMVRVAGQPDAVEPATASSEPMPAVAAAPEAAPAAAPAPVPAPAQAAASDDLEAARRRIAELEAQVRKEDAVRRAIRPAPMPQPSAGGAPD
jgi:hypothetical protein